MEKLLKLVKQKTNQAEVYALEENINLFSVENGKLKNIETKLQSGISLRIIKDGKLGFAYTRNLIDRQEFIENTLTTLKGNAEVKFEFPLTNNLPMIDTYCPATEAINNSTIVNECQRISEILITQTNAQVNIIAALTQQRLRLINASGTDLTHQASTYLIAPQILFPNTYAGIGRLLTFKEFKEAPDDYLEFLISLYNRSTKAVKPDAKRMKVLFMPESVYVLMWRLQSATSSEHIYQKESPLIGKINKKIFSEKLTVVNNPLNDNIAGARAFDDEGSPCLNFPIVENGVLKNYYYDLDYAAKMSTRSTGHGFRSAQWSSDRIALKPGPALQHLEIKKGNQTFAALIKSIDCGIIVVGALGAHSGNILNGDFSIGLSPGLYVENGAIQGYVKDTMIAGNIYDLLNNIVEIEDTNHYAHGGYFPALLIDNVSVAVKK